MKEERFTTEINIEELNSLMSPYLTFELFEEEPVTYQAQLFDPDGTGTSLVFRIHLQEEESNIAIQFLTPEAAPTADEWMVKDFQKYPQKHIESEIASDLTKFLNNIGVAVEEKEEA